MILPVYAYGQPVLKRRAAEVDLDDATLPQLIDDMWATMYNASGVGLAAPQIGQSKRIFLVDTVQLEAESEGAQLAPGEGVKLAFVNAEMVEEDGDDWAYEEGCLSIPHIRGEVDRSEGVTIRYFTPDGTEHERRFTGVNARVVQHEYDHIEGILFTERLKPLKRRLVARKLDKIKRGQVDADYRMKFART